MIFSAALVTLKQHRFEVGVAALAAIAAGAFGLSIAFQIDALGVSQACLDSAIASEDGSGVTPECLALVREGWGILGETFLTGQGTLAVSVMGVLPFLLGLLGGVPIVAREMEARTAQTAWSLNGSRVRWLARQVGPIAIVLGFVMIVAAFAAGLVADASVAWGRPASSLIGLHGPLAVARAFGAFGVGLVVGALLGRTLPAFLFGVAISVALLFAVSSARDAWLARLEPVDIGEISPATGEFIRTPRAVITGWGWITPDGTVVAFDEAMALVPAEVVAQDDPVQFPASSAWLAEHGYTSVQLGVTDELALGWAPYDAVIFGFVGIASLAATMPVVNRRRPM